jgi:GAF domain-containing protein
MPTRRSAHLLLLAALTAIPLLALIPVAQVVWDWNEMRRVVPGEVSAEAHARGWDWVVWQDGEAGPYAAFVFPGGPGDRAGLARGDVFYSIGGSMIISAADVAHAVEGARPGTQLVYEVMRGDELAAADVQIGRYPTFLYPLSPALWRFGLWTFALGALLHVIALLVAAPLARGSARARVSLMLIGASALWFFTNLARLGLLEVFGPPRLESGYAWTFEALTLLGLIGWLAFPPILLTGVLSQARLRVPLWTLVPRLLPALVLLILKIAAAGGGWGPFSLDQLVGPLLFYASVYVALAAGLSLAVGRMATGWGRAGSLVTLVFSAGAALVVPGVVPLLPAVGDAAVGWLVVSAQLLYAAPVSLVALATLRYGKVDDVLTRAVAAAVVFGTAVLVYIAAMSVLDPFLRSYRAPVHAIGAGLCLGLFLIANRVREGWRTAPPPFLKTPLVQARTMLRRFQVRMHTFVDDAALTGEAVRLAGQAMNATSGVLYYRRPGLPPAPIPTERPPFAANEAWLSASYHPSPPHLTADDVHEMWPDLSRAGGLWARSAEVSEVMLPEPTARRLVELGAAVALPLVGEGGPLGVLVLARKRRGIYNLDDLDVLRVLASQVALALERIGLIEREKTLARQTAEAQLVALRTQINPHFLFNTLNTIAALIDERPNEAERVVEHLAALFRQTLQVAGQSHLPLGAELKTVQRYLAIERARFGERLSVEIDVPDELLPTPLPALALQTMVENAVQHGLTPQRGGGTVRIAARETAEGVELTVTDDGAGLPPHTDPASLFGIGLSNVAGRMQGLHGRPGLLRLEPAPGGGTRARLLLPDAQPAHPKTAPEAVPG